ncbi:MAG TPA: bifunctional phosphoribosyl-AMP cyclohydrolase/phosphoribosyl-ATP diphosphatase HisIE [Candidatus Limnocylindria bacterium]|nr:bifunctional phosphoribosyl-AMP cyclohydrolase/phosphoribosyl-ATP diphosphatase HisIE [Candidatus Limnocylindria bacterium]
MSEDEPTNATGSARRADPGHAEEVAFDDRGLVPAIVQDAATGAVLMLAYMDREALEATLRTREVHFHSRSRGRLWKKGETSGNVLHLVDITADCDADALLVKAHPAGPACHTGDATCFGPVNERDLGRFLSELAAMLAQRKRDLPAGSYSADLFRAGPDAIAAKLVEEAGETAAALRGEGRARTISELTDLLYVMLVLATDVGATPDEIRASLVEKRAAAPGRRAQREGH